MLFSWLKQKWLSIVSELNWNTRFEHNLVRQLQSSEVTPSTNDNTPRWTTITFAVLLYRLLIAFGLVLACWQWPQQQFTTTRILVHDQMLYYGERVDVNWMSALFTGDNLYLYWQLCVRQPKSSRQSNIAHLLWRLHDNRSGSKLEHFFLQPLMQHHGKLVSVPMVIGLNCHRYLMPVVWHFHIMSAALAIKFNLDIVRQAFGEHYDLLMETSLSRVRLAISFCHSFTFHYSIWVYVFTHLVLGHTLMLGTSAFFIKFRQLNAHLQSTADCNSNSNSFQNDRNFGIFMRSHTATVSMLFEYNRRFGHLLVAFILFNMPQNTFYLIQLLTKQPPWFSGFIYQNYFCGQIYFMIALHVLAAMYTRRVHLCGKIIPKLMASNANDTMSSRTRIRLMLYCLKFHLKKRRYGITYGCFGLMSMTAFVKFLFLYGELAMFWFPIVKAK